MDPKTDAVGVRDIGARGRWHHEVEFVRWFWGVVRPLIGPALVVVALYWLVKYVITDEGLVLDYLRALAWPLVILGVVYAFRVPLANRLESLESVDSPWWNARFEKKAAKQLTDKIGADLSSFSTVQDEGVEPIPASGQDVSDSHDDGAVTGTAPVEESDPDDTTTKSPHAKGESSQIDAVDDAGANGAGHIAGPVVDDETANLAEGAKGEAGREVQSTRPLLLTPTQVRRIRGAEIRKIARRLGLRGATYRRIVTGAESNPESAERFLVEEMTKMLHQLSQRNRMYDDKARASVESVIQKSAQWGYDMGRAGAPRAVPDIEWKDDGTWKITTEVPLRRPSKDSASRARHIESLVKEIKELERQRHLGAGMLLPTLAAQDEAWLRELKRKLANADPGNPWAV